jgi:methionyl-tRNA formyltransferase
VSRVALYIMTERGLEVLRCIITSFGAEHIGQVIGARDAAIQNDHYDDILAECSRQNIPFSDRKERATHDCRYSLAVGWRWIIQVPENSELIVFHDSLLPRYRGFAPLVNALINQVPEIGVTAIFASDEYDRGDIIAQKGSAISYPVKLQDAISVNNRNYIDLAKDVVGMIVNNEVLPRKKQDEEEATYSLWRDDKDYTINWGQDSQTVTNFINALGYPYAGAASLLNGEKIRILEAEPVRDVKIEIRQPGKVIFMQEGAPVVVCGTGLLKIKRAVDESGNSILPLKKFRSRFE